MPLDRAHALEAEIIRIGTLGLNELRALWHSIFRAPPPPAFKKDLIARSICWHFQEQAHGALDQNVTKLLDGLARGERANVDRPRRLKIGTVLVREYGGERHMVTVVDGGYVWRDATYTSLTTIARAITGTAWSGPRFFGVRAAGNPVAHAPTPLSETKNRNRRRGASRSHRSGR